MSTPDDHDRIHYVVPGRSIPADAGRLFGELVAPDGTLDYWILDTDLFDVAGAMSEAYWQPPAHEHLGSLPESIRCRITDTQRRTPPSSG